jgi:hypothetical protein
MARCARGHRSGVGVVASATAALPFPLDAHVPATLTNIQNATNATVKIHLVVLTAPPVIAAAAPATGR